MRAVAYLNKNRYNRAGEGAKTQDAKDQCAPGERRLQPVLPFQIPHRQRLLALENQLFMPDIGISGYCKCFSGVTGGDA